MPVFIQWCIAFASPVASTAWFALCIVAEVASFREVTALSTLGEFAVAGLPALVLGVTVARRTRPLGSLLVASSLATGVGVATAWLPNSALLHLLAGLACVLAALVAGGPLGLRWMARAAFCVVALLGFVAGVACTLLAGIGGHHVG